MENNKICESCGMPMRKEADFGAGRTDNKYCVHCTDGGGVLKPYDVVQKGTKQFMMQTTGVSEREALEAVKEAMGKQPAWSDYKA